MKSILRQKYGLAKLLGGEKIGGNHPTHHEHEPNGRIPAKPLKQLCEHETFGDNLNSSPLCLVWN
jgi:hypothetical protein